MYCKCYCYTVASVVIAEVNSFFVVERELP